MRSIPVDLHLHTTASDGNLPSDAVVSLMGGLEFDLIAITDHDTIQGIWPAVQAGKHKSVKVLPGLEFSAGGEQEVHLLAYGFSLEDVRLQDYLESQRRRRVFRAQEMLDRLQKLGMPLALDPTEQGQGQSFGRAHLAREMKRAGHVPTVQAAFDRWLAQGRPAYVPSETPLVEEALERLRVSCPVLGIAHPGLLRMGMDNLLACLPAWKEAGLNALEVYHSSHAPATASQLDGIARRHRLLVTGGSDFHGQGTKDVSPGQGLSHWSLWKQDTHLLCEICNA